MQQMALYQQLAAAQQLGGDVQYALLAQQQQQAVAAAGEAELPDLVIPHMFSVVLPVHLHTGWCSLPACLMVLWHCHHGISGQISPRCVMPVAIPNRPHKA